ncbi:hypothetical protein [Streptomyces sp. 147326]|uniref:hypothetical protein n=1 Tax=Streptomyces sp. 147326 TaxID=3074379 RepID=UPI003857250D
MGKHTVGPGFVDEELVQDIARAVVERAVPGELALFRRQSKAYFRDPEGELKAARKSLRAKPKDEALGFGGGEVAVALAPFILAVVQGVVVSLTQSLATTAADRSQEGIRRLLRRVLRRPEPAAAEALAETPTETHAATAAGTDAAAATPAPGVPLSPEQLGRIRAQALAAALELGLDEDRAVRLADALVDTLTP